LYRRWRDGERKIEGQLTDYAFFIQALLDLFEAAGEPRHLELALSLQEKQNSLFWDGTAGGYFSTVEKSDLILRLKDDADNVTPAGNSIAALNGLRLPVDGEEKALKTLEVFAPTLQEYPVSLTSMLKALLLRERGHGQIVVIGPKDHADTQELLKTALLHRPPTSFVIPLDPLVTQAKLATIVPALGNFSMVERHATAYVCANFSCQKPTTKPEELKIQLEQLTNG
jgi:uncharacterized protein YyaL (SSP411 family)